MNIYPCKDCIVKLQCVNYCDKLTQEGEVLFNLFVESKKCPDCGHNMFNKLYNKNHLKIKCLGCEKEYFFSQQMGFDPMVCGMIRSKTRHPVDAKEYYAYEVFEFIRENYNWPV